MTATEASRNFSGLLDLIEAGETVRITRGGDPIAEVGPARRRTGADLEAALRAAHLPPLDDELERDIAESLALVTNEGVDPWADA
jgi:antitoxin (DNA-binding transcriptional repressor) of toxin-antitoxin stability system